jgi:hypothetical protein
MGAKIPLAFLYLEIHNPTDRVAGNHVGAARNRHATLGVAGRTNAMFTRRKTRTTALQGRSESDNENNQPVKTVKHPSGQHYKTIPILSSCRRCLTV